jgi:methylenetetrahydrofolate--tRNA-(uracil-5-)-methyltransferase
MIPGLEKAEFVRLGSLHRNTFINSPTALRPTLQMRSRESLFVAGQLVGVEGYVESSAAGLLAGINAVRLAEGQETIAPPATTSLGSLLAYITDEQRKDFQPMNANYGLFSPIEGRFRGREKKEAMAARADAEWAKWASRSGIELSAVAAHSASQAGRDEGAPAEAPVAEGLAGA